MSAIRTCSAAFAVLTLLLWIGGCATHEAAPMAAGEAQPAAAEPIAAQPGPAQPQVMPVAMGAAPAPPSGSAAAAVPEGYQKLSFAYPPGAKEPCCVMEKIIPKEIVAGQPFEYQIIVSSVREGMCMDDVVVHDRMASGFTLAKATPEPASSDRGELQWKLGDMRPNQTQTIRVTGTASEPGELMYCGTLSGMPRACGAVAVVLPALKLSRAAPAEVCICDPIPVKLTVSNAGTGSAKNVRVEEQLPAGLAIAADGKTMLHMDAGTLAAGESREFAFDLKASKVGVFDGRATAAGDGNLFTEALGRTTVRQPVLAISIKAPDQWFVDRPFIYDITVANTGDHPSRDTKLIGMLPPGLTVISASDSGQIANGQVTWAMGDLAPQASRQVRLTFSTPNEGAYQTSMQTEDKCAATVLASAKTIISGIPAILLEVIDQSDPVAIGQEVTYQIVAMNQGSTAATNIAITCGLEDAEQYTSSDGPTAASISGQKISFAPLATLAPKAQAVWKVTVRAAQPADARFHVQMKSDQLTRPVEETEATRLFE